MVSIYITKYRFSTENLKMDPPSSGFRDWSEDPLLASNVLRIFWNHRVLVRMSTSNPANPNCSVCHKKYCVFDMGFHELQRIPSNIHRSSGLQSLNSFFGVVLQSQTVKSIEVDCLCGVAGIWFMDKRFYLKIHFEVFLEKIIILFHKWAP